MDAPGFGQKGISSATIDGESYKLDPYHFAFWRAAEKGYWEPEPLNLIAALTDPEKGYIDIGSWIGPTVLQGARTSRKVFCFEPDPTALRFLNWNLDLNNIRNVSRFGMALAAQPGVLSISSFGEGQGDSQSSLLKGQTESSVDVWAIIWDEFLEKANPGPVSLIKMDIEGAEFDVLPTMIDYLQRQRPAFLLSTHAPYLPENARGKAMQDVADLLSFSSHVYDEGRNPIDLAELKTPAAADQFCSYLFVSDPLTSA